MTMWSLLAAIAVLTVPGMCQHSMALSGLGVRLVDGTDEFSGRIQIYHQYEWVNVCSNFGFDHNAGAVVCRSLGMQLDVTDSVPCQHGFGAAFTGMRCYGQECSLIECQELSFTKTDDCDQLAAVSCMPNTPVQPLAECVGRELDVVLVVDAAGSTSQFSALTDTVAKVVRRMDIGEYQTRVGMLLYASQTTGMFEIGDRPDADSLITELSGMVVPGGMGSERNIGQAILDATNMFTRISARPGSKLVMVVFATGLDTQTNTQAMLSLTQDMGITVVAVGVDQADVTQMEDIATGVDSDHVIMASDSFDLHQRAEEIAMITCTPQPPALPECQGQAVDIIFALDASGSVTDFHFQEMRDFVSQVVGRLDVGATATRIGLIGFADDAVTYWDLNQPQFKSDLMVTIQNIHYTTGGTYTDRALTLMTAIFQDSVNQGSGAVAKVGVVLTDGQSTDTISTYQAVANAKADGVTFIAIGIGSGINLAELETIASDPTWVFEVDAFGTLATVVEDVGRTACGPSPLPMPMYSDCRLIQTQGLETYQLSYIDGTYEYVPGVTCPNLSGQQMDVWKCLNCGSSYDKYIFYQFDTPGWLIGNTPCINNAGAYNSDDSLTDPMFTQHMNWKEYNGASWQYTSMSLTCVG